MRSFGGLQESGIDKFASNTSSFYCSLERPRSLPEVTGVNIDEEDVKEAYLTLCNRAFSATFTLRVTLDDDREDYVIMTIPVKQQSN